MTLLISARVSPVTFSSPGILLIAANEQVLISVNINHTQVNRLCWYGIQVYANYKTHQKKDAKHCDNIAISKLETLACSRYVTRHTVFYKHFENKILRRITTGSSGQTAKCTSAYGAVFTVKTMVYITALGIQAAVTRGDSAFWSLWNAKMCISFHNQ